MTENSKRFKWKWSFRTQNDDIRQVNSSTQGSAEQPHQQDDVYALAEEVPRTLTPKPTIEEQAPIRRPKRSSKKPATQATESKDVDQQNEQQPRESKQIQDTSRITRGDSNVSTSPPPLPRLSTDGTRTEVSKSTEEPPRREEEQQSKSEWQRGYDEWCIEQRQQRQEMLNAKKAEEVRPLGVWAMLLATFCLFWIFGPFALIFLVIAILYNIMLMLQIKND